MAYYLVAGVNGVVIQYSFHKAQSCQRYIHKSRIKKFEYFEDAEAAALEHLSEIVPYYVTIPDHIKLNELVTRARLYKEEKEGTT